MSAAEAIARCALDSPDGIVPPHARRDPLAPGATPLEHVVDAADMQQRAVRALLDRKRPTVLGDALVQIALELTLLRMAVTELAKRERWYQAKLRDAYHVIGNSRR